MRKLLARAGCNDDVQLRLVCLWPTKLRAKNTVTIAMETSPQPDTPLERRCDRRFAYGSDVRGVCTA